MPKVGIIGHSGLVAQRHKVAWDKLKMPWVPLETIDADSIADVDVVDICTPIYLHPTMVSQAVELGKKVICEKPIASSVRIARELLHSLAPDKLDRVCIVYQFRYNPVFLQLKQDIAGGKYGSIKLITVNYYRWKGGDYFKGWRASKIEAGGGVLLNVTIHYLDLLQWVFGYPTEIQGMTANMKAMDVEDVAVGTMRFPQGAVASVTLCSHVEDQKHMELSVYGDKGSTTIQMRENEYHAENFKAFLDGGVYVTPTEALKSLMMVEAMYARN